MKSTLIIFSIYSILSSSVANSKEQQDWSHYPDFFELRQEIGWSDDFVSRCQNNRPLTEMVTLIKEEKWNDTVELGEPWLQSCPIDFLIHYYTSISLSSIGRRKKGEYHFYWMRGLMDAIIAQDSVGQF